MPEAITESVKPEAREIRPGEFHGNLGAFGLAAYNDLVGGGMSREVSHVIAGDYLSDLGNAMKSDAELASRVGKANKSGEARIAIGGKSSKVRMTNAMALVRLAQRLDDLRDEVLYSRKIDVSLIPNSSIREYFEGATGRASKMVFRK